MNESKKFWLKSEPVSKQKPDCSKVETPSGTFFGKKMRREFWSDRAEGMVPLSEIGRRLDAIPYSESRVVTPIAVWDEGEVVTVYFPWIEGVSLQSKAERRGLDPAEIPTFLFDVLTGLGHLHTIAKVAHGDLCSLNITREPSARYLIIDTEYPYDDLDTKLDDLLHLLQGVVSFFKDDHQAMELLYEVDAVRMELKEMSMSKKVSIYLSLCADIFPSEFQEVFMAGVAALENGELTEVAQYQNFAKQLIESSKAMLLY